MYSDCLEIIFKLDEITALHMWNLLIKHEIIINGKVEFNDGIVSKVSKIESIIKKKNYDHFVVDGEYFDTSFGVVGRYKHILFKIRSSQKRTIDNWQQFLSKVHTSYPFIQARLSDCEYNYWQNAHDIIQYSSHNRSYEGLLMKSNDLPFPLEQKIIDTSQNPGRRVLKEGYVEFVSSHMWISEHFLELISDNKEAKISKLKDNFNVAINDGLLFIELSEELYTEENNNPDSLNRLREIIYN